MKLGIDISPAVYHRGGIGVYARALYTELNRLPEVDLAPVYNHAGPDGDTQWLMHTPVLLPWKNKPWRFRVLLSHLLGVGQDRHFPEMDVFLATDHLLPKLRKTKQVFVINDVTFRKTQTASTWNKLYLSAMLPRFLHAADAIITPSHSTRDDVRDLYHVPTGKMHVIPDGVDLSFKPALKTECDALRQKYGLPERFILAVGTIEPRKNYEGLIKAYAQLGVQVRDVPLVIAGKRGWRSSAFFELLAYLDCAGEVRLLDYVPFADLAVLYSAATLFVYPSLYEGFGLPPLEAMACGTPVITSNTSSLPEVVGDAGIMVSPEDTSAWVDEMASLLDDAQTRMLLRQKGLVRAQTFTWERTAQATLEVCRSVS